MNDFQVFLKNKANEHGLMCDCTAVDNNVQVNNIAFSEEITKIKNMNRVERMLSVYSGPDFYSLDERLQKSFMDYLNEVGINEHLAAFIEVMATDKDQRIYAKWLEHMKNATA